MKGKGDGAPRSDPRRNPSPFFVSLRILRALAGALVVVAALGLIFSLAPSFSGVSGRSADTGTAGNQAELPGGPGRLAARGASRTLDEVSGRLAEDLAARVELGGARPGASSSDGEHESCALDIPNILNAPDRRDWLKEAEQWDGPPRLIIVIDDLGENMASVRRLLALPYSVILAVWPGATHAREAAELAHAAGRQVLVHMPMQPRDPGKNMGALGLTVDMPESVVASRLRQALARVPHAVGLNNHMGSRFTSNAAAVDRFCRELRRQAPGFLVLDSLTLDTSVLYEQARKQGFRAFRRNVFLDDTAKRAAVLRELDRAAALARKHGMAIAIGHPYPETLAALAAWKGYARPGLEIGSLPVSGRFGAGVPAASPQPQGEKHD